MATSRECIEDIIRSELGFEDDAELGRDATFEELGGDSLDVISIVIGVERQFDIDISDADAESFVHVGDLITYIEGRCGL